MDRQGIEAHRARFLERHEAEVRNLHVLMALESEDVASRPQPQRRLRRALQAPGRLLVRRVWS
jgi:hypothetical protein